MESLAIYPFTPEVAPLARHMHLLAYSSVVFVAPEAFGFTGIDASTSDGGPESKSTVISDLDQAMKNCDAFYLAGTAYNLSASGLYSLAKQLIQMRKKLYIPNHLQAEWDDLGLSTIDSSDCHVLASAQAPVINGAGLRKVPVPVIFVAGMGEQCGKYDMQLYVRDYFLSNGYKVSQLGTKEYSPLLGFEALPDFVYKPMRPIDKAICFNRFVRNLVRKEKPEVVIIGVPSGIIPISEIHPEYLGELAYVMTSALRPDALILNLYASVQDDFFFSFTDTICRHRFSVSPSFFAMSQVQVEEKPGSSSKLSYIYKSNMQVQEIHLSNPSNVVMLHDETSRNLAFQKLVDGLSENIAIL